MALADIALSRWKSIDIDPHTPVLPLLPLQHNGSHSTTSKIHKGARKFRRRTHPALPMALEKTDRITFHLHRCQYRFEATCLPMLTLKFAVCRSRRSGHRLLLLDDHRGKLLARVRVLVRVSGSLYIRDTALSPASRRARAARTNSRRFKSGSTVGGIEVLTASFVRR